MLAAPGGLVAGLAAGAGAEAGGGRAREQGIETVVILQILIKPSTATTI